MNTQSNGKQKQKQKFSIYTLSKKKNTYLS